MATLTETAYYSRKAINILAIVAVGFFIVKILWGVASGIIKALFPAGPPPANTAFGKLPYPNAQNEQGSPSAAIAYTLEIVGDELPVMPKTIKVYLMPHNPASFDAFAKMKAVASRLGFTDEPRAVGKSMWQFVDPENPLRSLEIDQTSLNFHLNYNFLADQNLFNEKALVASDKDAPASFLQSVTQQLPDDIAAGKQSINYFKFDSGKLVPTTSLSTADALSVTFNRADIPPSEEFGIKKPVPVVYPDPKQGLVSVLISPSSNEKKKILEARFFYTPIQLTTTATYPTTTSQQAFEMLKTKKAFFATLPNPIPEKVTIREVYIAYLDPYPSQSYLQPVLVFSDKKGFVAYVPLVSPDWLVNN